MKLLRKIKWGRVRQQKKKKKEGGENLIYNFRHNKK